MLSKEECQARLLEEMDKRAGAENPVDPRDAVVQIWEAADLMVAILDEHPEWGYKMILDRKNKTMMLTMRQ